MEHSINVPVSFSSKCRQRDRFLSGTYHNATGGFTDPNTDIQHIHMKIKGTSNIIPFVSTEKNLTKM